MYGKHLKKIKTKVKEFPKDKPIDEPIDDSIYYSNPAIIPKDVLDALSRIETKLNELIEEDKKVHAKIEPKTSKDNFDEMCEKAKKISKDESCVQHVNRVSDGVYKIENWYDAGKTEASYENGIKK